MLELRRKPRSEVYAPYAERGERASICDCSSSSTIIGSVSLSTFLALLIPLCADFGDCQQAACSISGISVGIKVDEFEACHELDDLRPESEVSVG